MQALTAAGGGGGLQTIIVTMNGSATWVAPVGVTSVDYLVVAGGGGSGGDTAGGGGAGGFLTGTGLSVTAGNTYSIAVGAGGAGGTTSPLTAGSNGSNSIFSTITSNGGGGAVGFLGFFFHSSFFSSHFSCTSIADLTEDLNILSTSHVVSICQHFPFHISHFCHAPATNLIRFPNSKRNLCALPVSLMSLKCSNPVGVL